MKRSLIFGEAPAAFFQDVVQGGKPDAGTALLCAGGETALAVGGGDFVREGDFSNRSNAS